MPEGYLNKIATLDITPLHTFFTAMFVFWCAIKNIYLLFSFIKKTNKIK